MSLSLPLTSHKALAELSFVHYRPRSVGGRLKGGRRYSGWQKRVRVANGREEVMRAQDACGKGRKEGRQEMGWKHACTRFHVGPILLNRTRSTFMTDQSIGDLELQLLSRRPSL